MNYQANPVCRLLSVAQMPSRLALVLYLIMGGCATADGARSGSDDLAASFRDLAVDQLALRTERSDPLPPEVKRALLDFVDGGVETLYKDGATAERVTGAEANLEAFISRLIVESNTSEQSEIDQNTLARVRSGMCPLYPFC